MSSITFPFKAEDFQSALALVDRAEGAYALGASSFWHGGIHLSLPNDETAVVAPADGEVVAQRTMKKRTTGKSSVTINEKGEKISTDREEDFDSSFSFVLTRHVFETPEEENIEYFLLHMHLLCYENYKDKHKANPPPYLSGKVQHFVNTSEDKGGSLVGDGINLRAEPKGGRKNVITVLPKDTEFEFKNPGDYVHEESKGYFPITVLSPKQYSVPQSWLKSGRDSDGRLALLPVGDYYQKYGALYRATIVEPQPGRMGVPLIVDCQHVGDLIPGQTVYLFENPDCEGDYEIILDNIFQLITPEADGEITASGIWNRIVEGGSYLSPSEEEIITFSEAILGSNVDVTGDSFTGRISVTTEEARENLGQIAENPEMLTELEVNGFIESQCGVPAIDASGNKLIDVPIGTVVNTISPVSIADLESGEPIAAAPVFISNPSEGYIYCSGNKVRRKVHETGGVFDKVEVLDPPIEIRAGQVIGYPGSHEKQNSVHMELWLSDIDFFDNPKGDTRYETEFDLPAGLSSKQQKITKRLGQEVTLEVAEGTRLKAVAISKKEQGERALRKVKFQGKLYYVPRSSLGGYVKKGGVYRHSKTENVVFYDGHPDIEQEVVSFVDGKTPSEIHVDELGAVQMIDDERHYALVFSSDAGKITHYVKESTINEHRLNLYQWPRFFKKAKASDLGFETSGFFESKEKIKDPVLEAYKKSSEADEMEPVPDYQDSHPLSHLLIQSGTEWSKKHKNDTGWAESVLEQMWKVENVSSLEEEQGITKDALKNAFTKTIKKYSDDISFFDELAGGVQRLPSAGDIWFAHPLRFLAHLDLLADADGPLWMQFAIQEGVAHPDMKEWTEPLASRVRNAYHKYAGGAKSSETAWCASFVSWCLGQAGYSNPKSKGSQSYLKHKTLKDTEVQYGAIAVFTDVDKTGTKLSSKGHVTFIYGRLSSGEYLCLGGNQGDRIKLSKYDCSGSVFVSYTDKQGVKHYKKWRKFVVPVDYNERRAPPIPTYRSVKEANQHLLNVTIEESKNGESSR